MPLLSYSVADFVPGTKIRSADVNSRFNDIKVLFNTTGLDDTNIQNAGITRATKLKTGTANYVLINASDGTMSEEQKLAISRGGTNAVTAAAAFNNLSPMTTLGDTIYGGSAGAGTRLAGNTTTTAAYLKQTGDGTNSAAPTWSTSAIAVANGGTGDATLTANNLLVGAGTSAVTFLAPSATANTSIVSNGTTFTNGSVLDSGTYTPTPAAILNITTATQRGLANYLRVGTSVTVSGRIDITPQNLGQTATISMTLPITSAFTLAEDAVGSWMGDQSTGGATLAGIVFAKTSDNKVEMTTPNPVATAMGYYYHFTYRIK